MRKVVLLCGMFLFAGLAGAAEPRRAPGFSLPGVDNQQYDLQDYRGKIVIVEIMRSDCPNCRPFSKVLEEVKTFYGGKVAILAITNPPDGPAAVASFMKEHNLTYPVLFDCGQVAFSYVQPNRLKPSINIPHIYIVDREGYIVKDFEFGETTRDIFFGGKLYQQLDEVLSKYGAGAVKPAAKAAPKKK